RRVRAIGAGLRGTLEWREPVDGAQPRRVPGPGLAARGRGGGTEGPAGLVVLPPFPEAVRHPLRPWHRALEGPGAADGGGLVPPRPRRPWLRRRGHRAD